MDDDTTNEHEEVIPAATRTATQAIADRDDGLYAIRNGSQEIWISPADLRALADAIERDKNGGGDE